MLIFLTACISRPVVVVTVRMSLRHSSFCAAQTAPVTLKNWNDGPNPKMKNFVQCFDIIPALDTRPDGQKCDINIARQNACMDHSSSKINHRQHPSLTAEWLCTRQCRGEKLPSYNIYVD